MTNLTLLINYSSIAYIFIPFFRCLFISTSPFFVVRLGEISISLNAENLRAFWLHVHHMSFPSQMLYESLPSSFVGGGWVLGEFSKFF